ncbi:MAG TPA: endonuclease/exonuclease/phosphatase family protein [Pyrinomonadaceae bacterium]|nr:endonuclease/exonuclease/phosphatase family protein [Pyrinomonadaceae bacterium]
MSIVALAQDAAPVLFTQSGTTRAIALESVTHAKEPFSTFTQIPFGSDNRTRIAIFARNAQLFAGETVSAFTANVQDASGRIYPFAVESAVPLPQADGVTMLIVRVNEDLGDIGDVLLGISLRGMSSNRVRIGIGHVGGGPPDDTTPNEPPPTTGTRFKVMQWNVAYGRGTDNVVDVNRQATWMANQQVDLISLNEVPPENVSRYVDLLRQKTGVTWHSHWVAITPGNTVGQQVLTRHPVASTGERYLSFGRSVARVTVTIGGKTINFFSTHLSYESASWRVTQLAEMNSWMAGFSEQRVVAGDYNLSPNWAEYTNMTAAYFDSWAQAFAAGTAVSYPDNPEGRTRKGRIDYINYSKFAANLRLIQVKMPDQRDLNNHNVVVTVGNSNDWGVRPSDHNFLVTTFEVR